MAADPDHVEPDARVVRRPVEIGPAPDPDRTSLWIRSGMVVVLGLILVRLVGRLRRTG